MIGADLALAGLINRAAQTYTYHAPAYITYVEHTHITGFGRSEDMNRSVEVRVADNFAVMQDLPNGGIRTGEAFPIIPFFDPFSSFKFSYFANLKKVDIPFDPGQPWYFNLPATDPSVDVVVPYMSWIAPRYAADSTPDALHFLIDPTPRTGNSFYPTDVRMDPATQLPSHVSLLVNGGDMSISLDYAVVQGYWVVTQGSWSSIQTIFIGSSRVTAVTTFSDYTFPDTAPDPRLAGSPSPRPSASASP